MLKIAKTGNTTIRIASGCNEAGATEWTVYPYLTKDPTLQQYEPAQQNKIHELNITGLKDKEDLTGRVMDQAIAEAIARLHRNVSSPQYKDLGLVVDQIDVDAGYDIANILESEYNITPLEKQNQISTEVKG
jgi:hypothetical protein